MNDNLARCLSGVLKDKRPQFLKYPFNGPKALEELVGFDPQLVVGVLGGGAGTNRDTFELIYQAEKYGARVALFGRAPARNEPGELPADRKWRSLARALALIEEGRPEHDWQLVDLRWDRPDLSLREPIQLALASAPAVEPEHFGARRSSTTARADGERPRVR